jgi:hypothetical protein
MVKQKIRISGVATEIKGNEKIIKPEDNLVAKGVFEGYDVETISKPYIRMWEESGERHFKIILPKGAEIGLKNSRLLDNLVYMKVEKGNKKWYLSINQVANMAIVEFIPKKDYDKGI